MMAAHADSAPPPAERVLYGRTRSQHAVLELPPGAGPFPVAVLLHGGFWRIGFNRTLMNPLALDLLGRGWAVWNVEYRRLGIGWGGGGGWPATFADVGAGIDALADLRDAPLDLGRVFAIGHSAGGHLALWAAARPGLPAGAPGAARAAGDADVTVVIRPGEGHFEHLDATGAAWGAVAGWLDERVGGARASVPGNR